MKKPLPALTLIFMAGITFAHFCKIPLILLFFLAGVAAAMSLLSLKNNLACNFYLGILAFLFGSILLINARTVSVGQILNFSSPFFSEPVIVRGVIVSEPEEKGGIYAFVLRACQIQNGEQNQSCGADITVRVHSNQEFYYGEELVLRGRAEKIIPLKQGTKNSYQRYLLNRGILFTMKVEREAEVRRMGIKGVSPKRLALRMKKYAVGLFSKYASSLTAALLGAMVLGDKRNVPYFVNQIMIRSGTIHILVVSGFNVGVLCFVVILFLKLARINKSLRIILTVPILIFYCLLTGASTPVVRATIMATTFLLAHLFMREPNMHNSLALAAIPILINNPRQLFDASFQLSFVSVASLVILYPRLRSLLGLEKLKVKLVSFFIDTFLASLCAWLATSGFILYYFGIFSPVTVVANIFTVPLATLVTLGGFGLIMAHFLSPVLAQIFAAACEPLAFLILKANIFLIHLPYAYFRF